MIELLLFLFTDFDNRMGNFHTVKHKFNTYQECNDYIKRTHHRRKYIHTHRSSHRSYLLVSQLTQTNKYYIIYSY